MARTAEQILRELVADYTFKIATLLAEIEKLREDLEAAKKEKE